MTRWRITIEVWPHSSGNGADVDQKDAGERTNYFYVNAYEIDNALEMARCFQTGILINPAVWKANIFGIHKWPVSEEESK